jgi:hypothetical protein
MSLSSILNEVDLWDKARGGLDCLQIWRAVVNISNKQSWTDDKKGASILAAD